MKINPETYKFTFGKFDGYTYQYVKDNEPSYILWCVEHVKWFELDTKEYDEVYPLAYDYEVDQYELNVYERWGDECQ